MQGCEHKSRVLTPTAEIPTGTPMGKSSQVRESQTPGFPGN
jgi:hypothetical protein